MTNPATIATEPLIDFSLTRSGLPFQIQRLLGSAAAGHLAIRNRTVLMIAVTWLPLLILSLAEGLAYGSQIQVPFLADFAVHVRFLIALPILILSEVGIHHRLQLVVTQFVKTGLVPHNEYPAFTATVERVTRLRDRLLPELVLLALAIIPSITMRGQEVFLARASTWHLAIASGAGLSGAGWWFSIVSSPLFRFLLLRWVWRMTLWAWFLKLVSRLRLVLIPTHPDRAAGLGFVTQAQLTFAPIVFAGSAVVAAQIGDALAYGGAALSSFKFVLGIYVLAAVVGVSTPLLLLQPRLQRVKKAGLLEYGVLASNYTQRFDAKWVHGQPPENEVLLGTADIQSLADLNSSFTAVQDMRIVPIDKPTLVGLATAALLPMVPLVILATPADQLLHTLLKLLA